MVEDGKSEGLRRTGLNFCVAEDLKFDCLSEQDSFCFRWPWCEPYILVVNQNISSQPLASGFFDCKSDCLPICGRENEKTVEALVLW